MENLKDKMKAQKRGLLFMLAFALIIFTFTFGSSVDLIETQKVIVQQGETYLAEQFCANSTYANISSIKSSSNVILSQTEMIEVSDDNYHYNFTNTSTLGIYQITSYCDENGVKVAGEQTFEVTPTGFEISSEQTTFIIIGIVVLLFVSAFFFILSYIFKHPGTKIFLMALSSLTMIIIIGLVSSNANIYLAQFPNVVSFYSKYYIFMTYVAWAIMFGIVGWLIYYSLKLFNKSRGVDFDD